MSLGGNAGGRAVEEATPEGGAGVEFTGLPSREAEFLWVDTDHRRSFGRLPRQVGFTVFFQNLGMAKGNYFPFFCPDIPYIILSLSFLISMLQTVDGIWEKILAMACKVCAVWGKSAPLHSLFLPSLSLSWN